MNTHIRSSECAWHQSELKLLGRTITGLRGWEVKKAVDKEHLHAAGQNPLDITEGNITYDGNIKVLGFEADALNQAAQAAGFDGITGVPHELIVMTIRFKKSLVDRPTFITVRGMAFTEDGDGMEQGAKNREVTLPFLAMDRTKATL